MTKTVEAVWNFDMDAGKKAGIVLLTGVNLDGSQGIGYGIWDDEENAWCNEITFEPMPNFTPKAWLKDFTIMPELS